MKGLRKNETVSFSSKGQIVIPAWLRKEFQIGTGSKAIVEATDEGILLRPITSDAIEKLHGILKQPDAQDLREEWAQHKRDERAFEDSD